MSLRNRIYFFDPANDDRFNSRDIPTEQTMADWSDSVPFIKEVVDRSQLLRAGIAKTTTDAKVNASLNDDAPGTSPSGFTTFVRPAQIPLILNSPSITWSRIPRGGVTTGDTGVGIEDWSASVNFPAIFVPVDTDDLVLAADVDTIEIGGALCSATATPASLPAGASLESFVQLVATMFADTNNFLKTLADAYCSSTGVDVGDIIMSITPSSAWSSAWLEPAGQSLPTASYPALFAIIGYAYGGAGPSFNLPNLTTGNRYLRAINGPVSVLNASGGSNTATLNVTNIPLHTHTFSGNTNSDGTHQHTVDTSLTLGNATTIRRGDATSGSYVIGGDGAHNHTFTGVTDAYGQNPPTPIAIEPSWVGVYLKMKVL